MTITSFLTRSPPIRPSGLLQGVIAQWLKGPLTRSDVQPAILFQRVATQASRPASRAGDRRLRRAARGSRPAGGAPRGGGEPLVDRALQAVAIRHAGRPQRGHNRRPSGTALARREKRPD